MESMTGPIKQVLTVQSPGVLEVRSPELRAGDRAEVTVVLIPATEQVAASKTTGSGDWRRYAGAWNSGNPRSADNEGIDADLAREYMGETDRPEAAR